jgi:predicted amidohydrolase
MRPPPENANRLARAFYGCQLDIAWEDKAANCSKVEAMLARTPLPEGALVALPEMFGTGFSLNLAATAEQESGATESFLSRLAVQHRVFLLGGVVRASPSGRGRNEVVVFGPAGDLVARYAKMHPFTPGGEDAVHEPGDDVLVFDWGGCLVAPVICYDLRFPEVFRVAARKGAQLFVVIANWPAPRAEHWVTLLRARAMENQAYVLGVNRCGSDPNHRYAGGSLAIGPQGEVLADAGDQECLFPAQVDLSQWASWREEFPAWRDLRADLMPQTGVVVAGGPTAPVRRAN